MRPSARTTAILALALLPGFLPAQDLHLALTADGRGALHPCTGCGVKATGGLARRAGVFAELGERHPGLLRLDAGNAWFGSSGRRDAAELVRKAYDRLDYDVVNVGYRDFRVGVAGLRRTLAGASFTAVSANLTDARGKLLFAPYSLVRAGATAIAVVGVTEDPPGREHLPHLRRQLEGVTVLPAVETLGLLLPKVNGEAVATVLLYYGSLDGLMPILAAHGHRLAAVLVGGVDPAALPSTIAGTPVVGAADRGREVSVLSVPLAGGTPTRARVPVGATAEADAAIAALVAPATEPESPAPDAAEPGPGPPPELELGAAIDLRARGRNRVLLLEVTGVALRTEVDGVVAAEGRALLVVDTAWENAIPPDLAYGLGYGEGGSVADLRKRLLLTIDGDAVRRLHPGSAKIPGHLPDRFGLAEVGSRHAGKAVFEVPATPLRSATLCFFSQSFAPIRVPLVGPNDGAGAAAAEPALGPDENPLFALGVWGWDRREQIGGQEPPPGCRFLVVDLRGRSRVTAQTDARALDRAAAAKDKESIGLIADYARADATLHLLVDGEYVRTPRWELGTLERQPPLFPDQWVGGGAVFVVPDDARSLELVCAFGSMGLSTGGGRAVLPALRFPLAGASVAPGPREALARVDDDLPVEIVGLRQEASFQGRAAPEGKTFAVVTVRIRNPGADGGVYLPYQRFRSGEQGPDPVSRLGRYAPPESLWLGPGDQRAFELVFAVPAATTAMDLRCITVAHGTRGVDLPLVPEAAGVGAGAAAVGSARPEDVAPQPEPGAGAQRTTPPAETGAEVALKPRGLAGVGLTAAEVNRAIERGRDFLWQEVQRELGETKRPFPSRPAQVLAALALVHSDAHREYPECDAMLQDYLRAARFQRYRVYQAATFMMTVEAYGDPEFARWLRPCAQSLVDGQGATGAWSYGIPSVPDLGDPFAGSDVGPFGVVEPREDGEALQLVGEPGKGNGDNSVTQFALLGLRVAERYGIDVPDEVWRRARGLFAERRFKDGGWSYTKGSSYGSMTCAGIGAVAIANWALGEEQPTDDPLIAGGVAWLAEHFSASVNPKHSGLHKFYYQYSLERVGRLLDREFIGRHEWYPLGAKALVQSQLEDGGWIEKKERIVPTAFALLFLTRATPQLVAEEPTGPGRLRTSLRRPAPTDYYFVLDASGSMNAELGGQNKLDAAREALRAMLGEVAEDQRIALRVYGHSKNALQEGADEDTELIVAYLEADAGQQQRFAEALLGLRARGKTPLSLSLEQAAKDLRRARKGKATVVLLTDGGEDTGARRDPVAAAEVLGRMANVRLDVIGFDVGRPEWGRQLRAMVAAAGGRGLYWPAADGRALRQAVRGSMRLPVGPVRILSADGDEVAAGAWGDAFELPPGDYLAQAEVLGQPFQQRVRVLAGRTTWTTLNLQGVRSELAAGGGAAPPTPNVAPAPAAEQFCTGCGQRLRPGARFCSKCGRRVQ